MSIGLKEKAFLRLETVIEQDPSTALYLVDGLGLSGKTKALADLVTGLDESRYRPVVCRFRAEGGPIESRLNSSGVALRVAPCKDRLNVSIIGRLARIMREERPTVVHCYNPRAMLYGGLAARLSGVTATVGSLSAFACLVPDREFAFLPQRLFTMTGKNRLRNRLACRFMRHLVSVSRTLGEGFCRFSGVPLSKLRVIPYGTDTDSAWIHTSLEVSAYRSTLGVKPDEILIGSVGRLVEQKDYPTQLRAFALAAQRSPRLKMLLVGDGSLRGSLERMAQDLKVRERVMFLGHTDQIPLVLRSLDVFVMTSKFEPFGVALIEAKSAGLPIVSTSVGVVSDLVGDGESGVVCPPGNFERLAEAFVTLADDADLRKRLGDRALREAHERHSLRAVVGQYEQLYDEAKGVSHYDRAVVVAGRLPMDQEWECQESAE